MVQLHDTYMMMMMTTTTLSSSVQQKMSEAYIQLGHDRFLLYTSLFNSNLNVRRIIYMSEGKLRYMHDR